MNTWKTIPPEELTQNTFKLLNQNWGLLTAGDQEKQNAMTISWGGMGIMWHKPVAFIFLRPQRYTKQLIDKHNRLSLSFYDESYKKMLTYMGTRSGRDLDKIKEQGLTTVFHQEIPYFNEANTVLFLKPLYKQTLSSDCFLQGNLIEQWYPEQDYHDMYVCEITDVMIKQ